MRLPPFEISVPSWTPTALDRWAVLTREAAKTVAYSGNNDAFEQMLATLRKMAYEGRFAGLPILLKRRLTARALTWLWINDEMICSRMLTPQLLNMLVSNQQPRLTRISLQQLAQLYFHRFDLLDDREGLRGLLAQKLLQQLEKLEALKIQSSWVDPLDTLKREGHWLLATDGPIKLVGRVRKEGRELGEAFREFGLEGFDNGRFGDICRAQFYLETLRELPLGAFDPVMDELQKPSVAKAPFEGNRRIGHVALEILIDRAGQEPGDAWQDFIINLAGDPRISSKSLSYREWWQPLGEARIEKVRAWLSKEDLRLFLQAVEQYGNETNNYELKRMFPARKVFLEGLFKLKLIRSTRLILGQRARHSVKRILNQDVKTSFASLDGAMSDKAVIYLDCGDFHLVEGSHSFKVWLYLAAPGDMLRSYEKSSFSHHDLTKKIPTLYRDLYPGLPLDAFVHSPNLWQHKVFSFLANNGISLDMECLLSQEDYRYQLRRYGIPVVNSKRIIIPKPVPQPEISHSSKRHGDLFETPKNKYLTLADLPVEAVVELPQVEPISARTLTTTHSPDPILTTPKKQPEPVESSYKKSIPQRVAVPKSSKKIPAFMREGGLSSLSEAALEILRYFRNNPGDPVRYAVNVFDIEAREIIKVLYGPLKGMCKQDSQFGWQLTDEAIAELDAFDKQQGDS